MLFVFNKVDFLLFSYCNEEEETLLHITSFRLKSKTVMEQIQTIPLTFYKRPTLQSTEFHSSNTR